jgi:hypothetical protein
MLQFASRAAGPGLSHAANLASLTYYCGSLTVNVSFNMLSEDQSLAITVAFNSHMDLATFFQATDAPNAWTAAFGRYYPATAHAGAPPLPPTPPQPPAPRDPQQPSGPFCWSGLECAQGYYCNRLLTRCLAKKPGGLACTDADQCASRACVKACEPAYPRTCHQVCADDARPSPWRLAAQSRAAAGPANLPQAGAGAAAGSCQVGAAGAGAAGSCPRGYRCQGQGEGGAAAAAAAGTGLCLPEAGAEVDCGGPWLSTPCASRRCRWRCAGAAPSSCNKVRGPGWLALQPRN